MGNELYDIQINLLDYIINQKLSH